MIEDLNLVKAIDFAVETEKLGQHIYSRLAKKFSDDKELSEVFSALAEDEQHHAATFEKLRDRVGSAEMSFEQKQYLRAVSLSDIFSGAGAPGKELENVKTREDALERAFKLERTTLAYYQAMKDVVQDEVIDEMIAEEKKHLLKVMQYMTTGAKYRGLGDSFYSA